MWAAACWPCCGPPATCSAIDPALPLVEQSLRQNRSQLMRMPQVHCAESYLSTDTIDLLRKEIGLQTPAAAS